MLVDYVFVFFFSANAAIHCLIYTSTLIKICLYMYIKATKLIIQTIYGNKIFQQLILKTGSVILAMAKEWQVFVVEPRYNGKTIAVNYLRDGSLLDSIMESLPKRHCLTSFYQVRNCVGLLVLVRRMKFDCSQDPCTGL